MFEKLSHQTKPCAVLVIFIPNCNTTAYSQRIVTIVFLMDEVEQTKLFYKRTGPIHKLSLVNDP